MYTLWRKKANIEQQYKNLITKIKYNQKARLILEEFKNCDIKYRIGVHK